MAQSSIMTDMNVDFTEHIVLPLLIFFSRVADVSLGTLRIILVSKSYKLYASILGFFEVLIWVVVIGQLMSGLDNYITYISYALGFAAGTYVGIMIEEKIAIGTVLLQVISHSNKKDLLEELAIKKIKTYDIKANGSNGEVDILYIIVTRKNYKKVSRLIKLYDPKAFFSVEDINIVQEDLDQILGSGKIKRLRNFVRSYGKRR